MADNTQLDPGTGGDTIRDKDRAGVKTPIVALDLSPAGSETLMNGSMPVTNTGTFAVQSDTELTTKDLDSGAGTDTQAVVGLVIAKSGGAANVSATDPLPVVVGSTTPVQIQGGANQIGKLAANSGVDIGDVDVTSSALPTGASTSAKQPALGTAGSASTDVITIQGIASGTVVPVADGGGSLTVDTPQLPTLLASGALGVKRFDDVHLPSAGQLPAALVSGRLDVNVGAALPAGANALGSVTVTGTPAVDTELPAAAALADGAANPTTPTVGAAGLLWNGTTWDRAKGDTTNGAFVNVKAMIALPAGSNEIGGVNVTKVAGTATSVNSGTKDAGTQRVILASDQTVVPVSDNAGSLTVDAPLATPVFTTPTPSTTGGWSKSAFAALTNTKTLIKNAAGTFGGYLTVYNPNATVAYVQIFDVAATASVTLGTTVADARIVVPATSAANMEVTDGVNMANGIVIACTTTATGSTAPGTGLDGTILYK